MAKAIEYRITQQLMQRREGLRATRGPRLVERLITAAAVIAGLALLGSYLQELLWVLVGASAVLLIGSK